MHTRTYMHREREGERERESNQQLPQWTERSHQERIHVPQTTDNTVQLGTGSQI